jgi:hypothetical protein
MNELRVQVGAWGCFDEFNRLEERMLSACSQQIQAIQECLKSQIEKKDASECSTGTTVEVSTFPPLWKRRTFSRVTRSFFGGFGTKK